MKRGFFFIYVIGFCLVLNAQKRDFESVKYNTIEKNIADEASNLFYPKLMKRFLESDSTFNLKEKRHLYYGYSFDENYSPYGSSDYSDSLRGVLKKEQLKTNDFKEIIRLGDSILKEEPFDLRTLNYQLYAYENLENRDKFKFRLNQMKVIIDAIISTGDGEKKKTAFYVLYTSHEYELLNILGLQFGGRQSLIEHYDYLTVAKNDHGIEGMYFEITPCLNSLAKSFRK
ncbi:DUF4919 domain-containing protein [Seonamhaeicola marinus]|uniref:DUF4919 domain-containing protein n=1 Tax=Seonamhaeicola marinus TaxID=1912246 RepID=A0A5D0HU88_9FLAO|nr:DUF4919 domain-containing protein [Seonamhaeicola marinus]TYA74878.1 DUF4919 domain-containing protein [Seonamhaeicola marinus]